MSEEIKIIRQEWQLCPFEWGLDDCVVVQSNAGKLVLVDVLQRNGVISYRLTPKANLKTFRAEDNGRIKGA